jgi:hypothetical protein
MFFPAKNYEYTIRFWLEKSFCLRTFADLNIEKE